MDDGCFNTTDHTTVAAAMAGDRDALQRLWTANRRWVAAIILAHKPRSIELEDLVQVVAIQVVRSIPELREPEAFRPWLRQVALNAARAAGRKETRRRNHLPRIAHHIARGAAQPDTETESNDHARSLLDLAQTLPDAYREPLLMRCVRSMSYRQIGAVLDLPETTIETRIARGRRMLRQLIAEHESNTQARAPARASDPSPDSPDPNTHKGSSFARSTK